MEIKEARRRIRRYLPIDRNVLHDDWPVSGDYPAFWLELGKTVAAFGNLENELTSACYALTAPPADFGDLQPDQIEAHLKWYAKVEGYRADAMFALSSGLTNCCGRTEEFPIPSGPTCAGGSMNSGRGAMRCVTALGSASLGTARATYPITTGKANGSCSFRPWLHCRISPTCVAGSSMPRFAWSRPRRWPAPSPLSPLSCHDNSSRGIANPNRSRGVAWKARASLKAPSDPITDDTGASIPTWKPKETASTDRRSGSQGKATRKRPDTAAVQSERGRG